MKPIQVAAGALLASAYATMVLGAYVKAIGAGMACSEWGTCNDGEFFSRLDNAGVAAEVAHRVAATTVMVAGAALLAVEFLHYRGERRLLRLTLLAAVVLAVQVSLGAFTIFTNLEPFIVTAHLAVATLFFALTLVIAMRVWRLPPAAAAGAPAPAAAPEAEATKTG